MVTITAAANTMGAIAVESHRKRINTCTALRVHAEIRQKLQKQSMVTSANLRARLENIRATDTAMMVTIIAAANLTVETAAVTADQWDSTITVRNVNA